jgi:HNH endonuclease
MKKPFPVERIKDALLAVEPDLTGQQRQMLMTHYANRIASMERIARFGDYQSYHSANSQYGTLAGRIADQLGYRSPGSQTATVATVVPERDEKGHYQWRMDDEVAESLEQLGWVSPSDDLLVVGDSLFQFGDVPDTEREALTKARIGQGIFRNEVVALWGCCAVTRCSLSRILVASHIVPWRDSTNAERLDPFNGLLLTPNFDRLFDQCLISFSDDGSILLSKNLSDEMRAALGVTERHRLRFVRPEMLPYLRRNRALFLETHG